MLYIVLKQSKKQPENLSRIANVSISPKAFLIADHEVKNGQRIFRKLLSDMNFMLICIWRI